MVEGEDLYDDLFEDVGDMLMPKASFLKSDSREEEFKKKEAELTGKLELLQKEVEALQQDKAILTRNISCLFKTAQMELARKDKQMKELREENLRFKLGGTMNTRPHLSKAGASGSNRGQSHGVIPVPSSEAPVVETDCTRQGSSESTRVSVKVRELELDVHRQSSGEGNIRRSPSRRRDMTSERGRRTVDDKDSRSDRPRDRRHDDNLRHGHSKPRSPERNRHIRRADDNLKDSDGRKRHRSLSGERDASLEDARAAKAVNRSGSERQNDHSNRYHR